MCKVFSNTMWCCVARPDAADVHGRSRDVAAAAGDAAGAPRVLAHAAHLPHHAAAAHPPQVPHADHLTPTHCCLRP